MKCYRVGGAAAAAAHAEIFREEPELAKSVRVRGDDALKCFCTQRGVKKTTTKKKPQVILKELKHGNVTANLASRWLNVCSLLPVRLLEESDPGLSGGLQHVGHTSLIIQLQTVQDTGFIGAVVIYGTLTRGWRQSWILDQSCYRKMLMLFYSRRLAQINLTSKSLIKFPHWSLTPLLSSVDDLIPSVLGDGLWRAAGAIFHRRRHPLRPLLLLHPVLCSFLIDNRGSFWPTFASAPWPKKGPRNELLGHFFKNPQHSTCVVAFHCVVVAVSPGLCVWSCTAAQKHRPIQTPACMVTQAILGHLITLHGDY